jgi:N utilization substance protein A
LIKLDASDLRKIQVFEKKTGVVAKDCFSLEDELVFLVETGNAARAVGQGGINIRKLKNAFGKNVSVIEHSKDDEQFLRNMFYPAKVKSFRNGGDVMYVNVEQKDKPIVFATRARKIRVANAILGRYLGKRIVVN